ncbi:MAG: hypothetical protein GXY53_08090 [Desulfobulbus sp.]|nr:hypothetical protein [Desulfobulbus sp.]
MQKRSVITFIAVLVFLVFTFNVNSAEINGFKGMRWGSWLADLQETKPLVLTKDGGTDGTSLYTLQNDDLRYGKAVLTGIHYSFTKKRLQGVMLLFSGPKNFAAARDEAFARFGKTVKVEQGKEELYNWPGKTTNILLSYNKSTQSGFLFMKAKILPPAVRVAAPPKPAAAPQQAGGAPVTENQQTAQIPSSHDEFETALDRAPPPAQSTAAGCFPPEILALIQEDQTLTQICWETSGPEADAACLKMRENIDQLNAYGLCMKPDSSGQSGTEVIWHFCNENAATTTPQPVAPPEAAQSGSGSAAATDVSDTAVPTEAPPAIDAVKTRRCRLIGELFATAAKMRDTGVKPMDAEEELTWRVSSEIPEITIERIRETVELVYFDQKYNGLSGEPLIEKVSGLCISGNGPYLQPLP